MLEKENLTLRRCQIYILPERSKQYAIERLESDVPIVIVTPQEYAKLLRGEQI